jgi:cell division protein FtsZ
MNEFMEASNLISQKAHEDANIIVGALFDNSLQDEMRVTVIATGVTGIEEAETIKRPMQAVSNNVQKKESEIEADKVAKIASDNNSGRTNKVFSRRNPGHVRKQSLLFPNTLDEAELETPTYLRQAAD